MQNIETQIITNFLIVFLFIRLDKDIAKTLSIHKKNNIFVPLTNNMSLFNP